MRHSQIHDLDLILIAITIFLSIIFITLLPDSGFIRIILTIPFVFFLPGYLLISSLFIKRGEISPAERFSLSVGFSIAINVFNGFALNYTPWGYRPGPIITSLSLIMGILLVFVHSRRRKLGETAYEFSSMDVISFYETLWSKDKTTGPEYDPALEKTFIKTILISIVIISLMLVYAIVTSENENFTTLYILGPEGKAEGYIDFVAIDKPNNIMVGIENHEREPLNYTLRVQFGDKVIKEQEIFLKHETGWLENMTFIPEMTSSVAMAGIGAEKETLPRLELVLLKDNLPYRSVFLWVMPEFDIKNYTHDVNISNGDMENTTGWNFKSTGEKITGSYNNVSFLSPQHSYEINFIPGSIGEYGEFYQNLSAGKETIADILFYVKDSSHNVTENISKQVLLDDTVIWEEGIGIEDWEQAHVPVFLSGRSRLAFRVYNKAPINDTVQVFWDEIRIVPITEPSAEKPIRPGNYIYELMLSKNYNSQSEFKIRGIPLILGKDKEVKIDGSNFPLFYYDIDENRSYEELDIVLINDYFITPENATYLSEVHGNEISFFGSRYKIIDKDNAGLSSKILMEDGTRTINLGEKWNLENDYSLSLDLVSSKGDMAMLMISKGRKKLESKLLKRGGIFQFKSKIGKNSFIVFKTKIDSISLDSVKVKETELYSDNPLNLKVGDTIGDFQVTNVSSNGIEMKNTDTIEINYGVSMLGGNIIFRMIKDMAFPYSTSGEIRGLPHDLFPGSSFTINGMNYPGFYYDFTNDLPGEELNMEIGHEATADTGNAVYRSWGQGDKVYFLGRSYWLPNPARVNLISGFSMINVTLPKNGSIILENGFNMSLKEKPDNRIEVNIREEMSESQKKLIEIANGSKTKFYKDLYYEIFIDTYEGRFKSNIMQEEDEFEYWIEYDDDRKHKLISGEVKKMDSQNVTMEIKQYELTQEILPGMTFGEFEVESITNGTIILRNTQPIKFEPGQETPILGGAIKIRTDTKGLVAYPIGLN